MFGLQHPLTCNPWTTLSNPCNKVKGKYVVKKSSCVFLLASLSLCRCELFYIYMCMYVDVNLYMWLYNITIKMESIVWKPWDKKKKWTNLIYLKTSPINKTHAKQKPKLIVPLRTTRDMFESFGVNMEHFFPSSWSQNTRWNEKPWTSTHEDHKEKIPWSVKESEQYIYIYIYIYKSK